MKGKRTVEIVEARSGDQIGDVASLMRDFAAWCVDRYQSRPALVETYLRGGDFDKEVVSLEQVYGPPDGVLLLALVDGAPAGCVAMRRIGNRICEMKRLFVSAEYQGLGLGKRLCEALLRKSQDRGYRLMRLDTGDLQTEAQSLYRSMGFKEIKPYYELHEDIRPYFIFMERALSD